MFEEYSRFVVCRVSEVNQGPVIQNFVSLMLLLIPQFVNYISTSKANTLLFFVDKMWESKGFSHFINKK